MVYDLFQTIDRIKKGGIVIFPTDTAYGIGCRIDDAKAVSRLFTLRRRPPEKATPVLVASKHMAGEYWSTLDKQRDGLIDQYWPGALTVVAQCERTDIPEQVKGGSNTIGLRMPDHSDLLRVIEAVGVPILGPSANFHGHPTPFSFDDLDSSLITLVDGVMDGVCPGRQASTVIDTTQAPWRILRQGALTMDTYDIVS